MQVAYFYDPEIGQYYYGKGHPMKPQRVRMAHSLILHYGLCSAMDCYRSVPAHADDMTTFHAEDYVSFLQTITQDGVKDMEDELERFNLLDDCPVFDGLWNYCQSYTGASLGAAVTLNYGGADIAINWSGGLHHGKKAEASGFCYVNDIVLAILELLKYHQRVLYIDIDVHHGDGVEEAFLTTDRVFTLSLHKFGEGFFPGTGDICNVGYGRGKFYSLNIPLKDGISDEAYHSIFRPVVDRIMQLYRPEVVVLQCGADSVAGDRLGAFNMSSSGHAACVEYVQSFGLPLMVLGGGGYKTSNVARAWTKETGVVVGIDLDDDLPVSEYLGYYFAKEEHRLTVNSKPDIKDQNSPQYLSSLRVMAMEYLKNLEPVPGVAFHERPPDTSLTRTIKVDVGSTAPISRSTLWDGTVSDDWQDEDISGAQDPGSPRPSQLIRLGSGGGGGGVKSPRPAMQWKLH